MPFRSSCMVACILPHVDLVFNNGIKAARRLTAHAQDAARNAYTSRGSGAHVSLVMRYLGVLPDHCSLGLGRPSRSSTWSSVAVSHWHRLKVLNMSLMLAMPMIQVSGTKRIQWNIYPSKSASNDNQFRIIKSYQRGHDMCSCAVSTP